jgi:hypothetical protein
MARTKFVASFYSNCSACEEVIEPGDDAGYIQGYDRAVCEQCLEDFADDEGWNPEGFADWRAGS